MRGVPDFWGPVPPVQFIGKVGLVMRRQESGAGWALVGWIDGIPKLAHAQVAGVF